VKVYPSYMALYESGELERRAREVRALLSHCELCPRWCGIDRLAGKIGYCRSGVEAQVASHNVHHGEEPPISGTKGSGTVFFSHCTMRCLFCQNYPISQLGVGAVEDDEHLASMFLELQRRGCHNLNLVTPTHCLSAFLNALVIAIGNGFRLPIVYNTSGYERVEILHYLDGVVDVYLPDIKYLNRETSKRYSDAENYIDANLLAVREMYRQVGELELDASGLAHRGIIIRHLVLPGEVEQSIRILETIAEEISPTVHVSLMSQYFPAHKAPETPPLDRRLTEEEYDKVVEYLETTDLQGWVQPTL
jgi:putative pyruvate formate lyase activating enzyme